MENYLKETLIFNNLLGCDTSFDFITGNDFFQMKTNNIKNSEVIEKQDNKNENQQQPKIIEMQKEKDEVKETINNTKIITNLDEVKTFEDIVSKIKTFEGCDLKRSAINDVIYDGNINAKIMLIGEAPGESEDNEGKPFCGKSGQLLRKALNCIHLNNENLFITNTVYWRPPENRKPYQDEIESCRPFLNKIIDIINPVVVILCGSTAIETILNNKYKMAEITGKLTETEINAKKIKVFPIYHPSYLLRVPSMKKVFWQHLLILQKEIKNYAV